MTIQQFAYVQKRKCNHIQRLAQIKIHIIIKVTAKRFLASFIQFLNIEVIVSS